MSVREAINGKKMLGIAAGAVLLLGAGIAIIVQAKEIMPPARGDVYYSNDDGVTFFADSPKRDSPFDKGGKPAYRARVFDCHGKRVVGFLTRLTDKSRKVMEDAKAAAAQGKPPPDMGALMSIGTTGSEIKKPGEPAWIQSDAVKMAKARVFRCPDGSIAEEVDP